MRNHFVCPLCDRMRHVKYVRLCGCGRNVCSSCTCIDQCRACYADERDRENKLLVSKSDHLERMDRR